MKLIVGLGNPGKLYIDSRHNIGFSVARALKKKHKIFLKKDSFTHSLNGKGKIRGKDFILTLPSTFMNLSGVAVSSLLKKYGIDLDNLLVVCDDVDLEFGKMRIKPDGSSGGHKGLASIIDSLRSARFARLRIGIGRPKKKELEVSQYVLSPFSREERKRRVKIIQESCQ